LGGGSHGSLEWNILAGAFAGIQSGKSGLSFPLRGELGFSLNTTRWNLGLQSIYEFDPSATSQAAHLYAENVLTLPGLWPSHSSSISVSYEDHPEEGSSYSTLARGYHEKPGSTLYTAGLGYSIPLAYPDLALGSILYIPRISLDPFLDYAYALDTGVSGSSVGADLLMHFHALQLPFRLNSGLRFAWLIETREPVVQFLLMGMAF